MNSIKKIGHYATVELAESGQFLRKKLNFCRDLGSIFQKKLMYFLAWNNLEALIFF